MTGDSSSVVVFSTILWNGVVPHYEVEEVVGNHHGVVGGSLTMTYMHEKDRPRSVSQPCMH